MKLKDFYVFALTLLMCVLGTTQYCVAQSRIHLCVNKHHTNIVDNLAVSRDGKYALTAGFDSNVKVWDLSNSRQINNIYNIEAISSFALLPDNQTVVTASNTPGGPLKFWNFRNGKLTATISAHDSGCSCVAYDEMGKLITCGNDGEIKIWNAVSLKLESSIRGHRDAITALAISDDGKLLATSGADSFTRVWNLEKQVCIKQFLCHKNGADTLRFSIDSSKLYSVSEDKKLTEYDLQTRRVSCLWKDSEELPAVALDEQRHLIAVGSWNGKITVIDSSTRQMVKQFGSDTSGYMALSFHGNRLLAACSSGQFQEWDVENGIRRELPIAEGAAQYCIKYTKDGEKILVGGESNRLRLFNLHEGILEQTLINNHNVAKFLSFNPLNDDVIAGYRQGIVVWSLPKDSSNAKYKASIAASDYIDGACYDPKGKVIVYGAILTGLHVVDANDFKPLYVRAPNTDPIESISFDEDGNHCAVLHGNRLATIYDTKDWHTVWSKHFEVDAYSSALSPDGKSLALGFADGVIQTCEWTRDGKHFASTLVGHSASVRALKFLKGGTLLSSSLDGSIRRWNLTTSIQEKIYLGHNGSVWNFDLDPTESTLVSASLDGTLMVWDLNSTENLCTVTPIGDTNWVVSDNVGRFDTFDLDAAFGVHWVIEKAEPIALPIEAFFRQYYTPRLLAKRYLRNTLPPIASIDKLNLAQPIVRIKQIDKATDDTATVTVSYSATKSIVDESQKSGVYDLRVFRDGQLVGCWPSPELERTDLSRSNEVDEPLEHRFSVKLPHNGAVSTWSAYAFNNDKIKSNTARKTWSQPNPILSSKPNAYVIAFGVNDYSDQHLNLSFAVPDALLFRDTLVPSLKATNAFRSVVYIPLISDGPKTVGASASKKNLQTVLDVLSGKPRQDDEFFQELNKKGLTAAGPDDVVILSFACHATVDEKSGEFYLLPSEFSSGRSDQNSFKSCISSSELSNWLYSTDFRCMGLVVDACHSAAALGPEFKAAPIDSAGLGQLAYYKKMRLLFACQSNDVAKETNVLNHGLLTYALLEKGLKEGQADCNPKDGNLSLRELFGYAAKEVPELQQELFNQKMQSAREVTLPEGAASSSQEIQTPQVYDFANSSNDIQLRTAVPR